jgi:CRISPR-associated protein (TIGR02584 family)
MTTEAVLFAVIGPNPAPVSEASWALARQRDVAVVEAHVVTMRRGQRYLEAELLGPGGALAALRALLPRVLPGGDAAVVTHAVALDDDLTAADAATYLAAIWDAARACVARAGARPVVHLLAGGRRRTMTAHSMQMFQLLARPGDELLDVRVSDPRAEGGTGFFFPEQPHRHLGELDARAVEVHLVPVPTTRLAGLAGVVGAGALSTLEAALAASQASVDAAAPPRLRLDPRRLHRTRRCARSRSLREPARLLRRARAPARGRPRARRRLVAGADRGRAADVRARSEDPAVALRYPGPRAALGVPRRGHRQAAGDP